MTVLPANLDDNQLDDPHAVPHPLTVYTVRTYSSTIAITMLTFAAHQHAHLPIQVCHALSRDHRPHGITQVAVLLIYPLVR